MSGRRRDKENASSPILPFFITAVFYPAIFLPFSSLFSRTRWFISRLPRLAAFYIAPQVLSYIGVGMCCIKRYRVLFWLHYTELRAASLGSCGFLLRRACPLLPLLQSSGPLSLSISFLFFLSFAIHMVYLSYAPFQFLSHVLIILLGSNTIPQPFLFYCSYCADVYLPRFTYNNQ